MCTSQTVLISLHVHEQLTILVYRPTAVKPAPKVVHIHQPTIYRSIVHIRRLTLELCIAPPSIYTCVQTNGTGFSTTCIRVQACVQDGCAKAHPKVVLHV